MKSKFYLILPLLFFVGFQLKAQDLPNNVKVRPNIVKVNVPSVVLSTLNLTYERHIVEDITAQLGFFYTNLDFQDRLYTGFGLTPEMRFYFTDEAQNGMYLAPYIRAAFFHIRQTDEQFDANNQSIGVIYRGRRINLLSPGLNYGYQWIFSNRIVVDAFFGLQYNIGHRESSWEGDANIGNAYFFKWPVSPRAGINIGFKF